MPGPFFLRRRALLYHDLWNMERYARSLEAARARGTRLVAYLPLDGAIGDPELVRPLRGFDRLLVFTEWARGELAAAAARLDGELPPVGVVPHGVTPMSSIGWWSIRWGRGCSRMRS